MESGRNDSHKACIETKNKTKIREELFECTTDLPDDKMYTKLNGDGI